ncbi:MAG: type I-C CRISPR-associated protein Cas7/Csd2 [Neomegalonema sp.]|nr:type I-C CRISPR-associated protein Cas7/Csd2 [Neomegalonema sp.]
MTAIANRYDFVYFFDVSNGNPNGDPDAGNLPRMDPETSQGLVSDVCLKRKIRNYVAMAMGDKQPHAIYVAENAVLNDQHRKAYAAIGPDDSAVKEAKKLSPKSDEEMKALQNWMCGNFFDIRTFGGVLSTGINCGQIRGPLQFTFARSEEAIMPLEMSITRMAATNEAEKKKQKDASDDDDARSDNRTMGRKHIVPYGLYRAHGYISAPLAERTGFSDDDLNLVWTALRDMFDHDRSASRGEMAARRLIIFRHDNRLGAAQAHKLFERVSVKRVHEGDERAVGDRATHNWPPARRFSDYRIDVDATDLPPGVSIIEPIG